MTITSDSVRDHPLIQEGYVKKLFDTAQDPSLYSNTPEQNKEIRTGLLRMELEHLCNQGPDFYPKFFEMRDVDPRSADLPNLIKLAISSDDLRGGRYEQLLVSNTPGGGKVLRSTGTTTRQEGKRPSLNDLVTVYISPIEYGLVNKVNHPYMEHLMGRPMDKAAILFLASSQMRTGIEGDGDFIPGISSLEYVANWAESKGYRVYWALKPTDNPQSQETPWGRFTRNKKAVLEFLNRSRFSRLVRDDTCYLIFSGNLGLQGFADSMLGLKGPASLVMGAPPIRVDGVWTGGGQKVPRELSTRELLERYENVFVGRDEKPASYIDHLAMTECGYPISTIPGTIIRVPNPLATVYAVNPRTMQPAGEGEEGMLLIHNPQVTWLQVVYPGDVVGVVPSSKLRKYPQASYCGRGFTYIRRTDTSEKGIARGACPLPGY